MANYYSQPPRGTNIQPGTGTFDTSQMQSGATLTPFQVAQNDPAVGTPFSKAVRGPRAQNASPAGGGTGMFGAGTGSTGGNTEGILSGPGYGENFYKEHGQDLMNPSASERLFDQGMEGSNPYYDYAEGRATKAINDASAARGSFNSSYTLRQIGDTVANLRGQQAKEMNDLAGQSDAARVGRYDATNRYAEGAQNATESRADRAARGYLDLAKGQAGMVDNFYANAGNISNKANMAAIEAALKESGLSASEIQNLINNAFQGAGVVSKFV